MNNFDDEEQSGRVKTVRTKPRRSYHEQQNLKRKKPVKDRRDEWDEEAVYSGHRNNTRS